MRTIGIIGSRHVGSNLAKAALAHDYSPAPATGRGDGAKTAV